MFGHQDNQVNPSDNNNATVPNDTVITGSEWQHPGVPLETIAPEVQSPASEVKQNNIDAMLATSRTTNDLIDIKQKALSELSPLVDHLDQSPEEKFRTTMMMIQASDDQTLIKVAYETAQKIADEKSRAQALLDIINEINYFTQQQDK